MNKPMIGVLPLYDTDKKSYWMLPHYMKAIEDSGGIPVMLPLTTDEGMITALAHTFDGFLFTGGHDVNPELYDERMQSVCGELCMERDQMEVILFKKVIAIDKPAFGICRGLQLFNVILGGTLYQDIPTDMEAEQKIVHQQKPPYTNLVHSVHIKKDNLLHDILQTDQIQVNSYHHQGIKTLSDQLVAVAIAEDGLVESVVMPGYSFVLAVQWHPEYSYAVDGYSQQLFAAFVRACSSARFKSPVQDITA
ncbi:gamma-glutamyl-gamma-aminobutyrate hydrolase family protein [Paenibacillus polysaccharolyticus]|uniref:gamma-glutamyl-gamma-aminobutyrate hydrolase family protein n=1 Tax=Paenibacillus polysaccharolyticus TaxID=582692 RepID=UPI002040C776|nr:gamma-glutamyl-gamma-aminobutyrate hydrolase family protein [Paenibacillus polysaccharolyticus]MCM3132507.1 gamma-glutamyl-gamma-aminobutyrate hydrolase family protein [Paenibacillus polysaccharolyticus]